LLGCLIGQGFVHHSTGQPVCRVIYKKNAADNTGAKMRQQITHPVKLGEERRNELVKNFENAMAHAEKFGTDGKIIAYLRFKPWKTELACAAKTHDMELERALARWRLLKDDVKKLLD